MGCAVFMALMVVCWLLDRLLGIMSGDSNVLFVLGLMAFGFGHLLAIAALFANKKSVSWWGRTALATMWASVLIFLFVGFAMTA